MMYVRAADVCESSGHGVRDENSAADARGATTALIFYSASTSRRIQSYLRSDEGAQRISCIAAHQAEIVDAFEEHPAEDVEAAIHP
jgi:hypothetical protein